uniref:C3HC-type domain-containing protein n=1 Tax=Ciona savignyi TaxID=51511 RepID=H2YM45_CIOSA
MEASSSALSVENIQSAIRPCKSVVDQVKSTLGFLLTSAVSSIKNEANEEDEKENIKTNTSLSQDESLNISANLNGSVDGSPKMILKSDKLRSKEAFKERVKSFTLQNWYGKPLLLNPMLYAQCGWYCVGEDMVKCSSCGTVQYVHLPWPNAENYDDQCLKTRAEILDGHMNVCSWLSRYCDDSLVIPFHPRYSTIEDQSLMMYQFKQRLEKLWQLKESLPLITQEILGEMGLSSEDVKCFKEAAESLSEDVFKNSINLSSALLAVCGWDTECTCDSPNPVIYCTASGRFVGLWNFHLIENDLDKDADAPDAKKLKTEDMPVIEKRYFHPLDQHHVWSPWVVTVKPMSAQVSDGAAASAVQNDVAPGWKVLKKLICDMGMVKSKPMLKTPPRTAIKQARQILNGWSSPM